MKVGILTYHRARNYGAFVQAYALQQQLRTRFPKVQFEIIDFEYRRSIIKKKIDYCKLFLKFRFKTLKKLISIDKAFKKEYHKLPLSKHIISDNTEKSIKLIARKYDCVIIGSDAVFNWTLDPIPNVYFFNNDTCKHITYAASVHLNKYKTATAEQAKYVHDSLAKMHYIGVRDKETECFVNYFNPECQCFHNCDPTVVLNMNYSVPTLEQKLHAAGIENGDQIIFFMLKSRRFGQYIKEKFGEKYKLVALRKENPYADIFLEDLTPLEWSKVFSYGCLTVTDFFHGSLLSLKNGTPVISIDSSNYVDYESKAKDLFVNRLNLPEMFYDMAISDDDKNIFIQKCEKLLQTDYTHVIAESIKTEARSFDDFCSVFGNMMENKI